MLCPNCTQVRHRGPCALVLKQIVRPHADLFNSRFGGILYSSRIKNTADAVQTWLHSAARRQGTVVEYSRHDGTSFDAVNSSLPNLWLVEDFAPHTPHTSKIVGRDITSRQLNVDAIVQLTGCPVDGEVSPQAGVVASPVPAPAQLTEPSVGGAACSQPALTITPLMHIPAGNGTGFAMFTTVFDDDPTRGLVLAAVLLDEFLEPMASRSRLVVVEVNDHADGVHVAPGSGCALMDAEAVLAGEVWVGDGQVWRVSIGQCPAYRLKHGNYVSAQARLQAYLLVVAVGTIASVVCVIVAVHAHQTDTDLRIAIAKHDENSRAHRWVIGYGEYNYEVMVIEVR